MLLGDHNQICAESVLLGCILVLEPLAFHKGCSMMVVGHIHMRAAGELGDTGEGLDDQACLLAFADMVHDNLIRYRQTELLKQRI